MNASADVMIHDTYFTFDWAILLAGGVILLLLAAMVLVLRSAKNRGLWLGLGLLAAIATVPALLIVGWLSVASYRVQESDSPLHAVKKVNTPSRDTQTVYDTSPTQESHTPIDLGDNNSESLTFPTNRPLWVLRPETLQSSPDEFTISSDPFSTKSEAIAHLNQQLESSVAQLASRRAGEGLAGEVLTGTAEQWKPLLKIDTRNALQSPVTGETGALLDNVYLEQVTFPQPVGEMYQAHAHVMVNEPFLQFVDARWRTVEAQRRLVQVGSTAGVVLLGLLVLSALLRVGPRVSATARGRLQSSGSAAILILGAVLLMP